MATPDRPSRSSTVGTNNNTDKHIKQPPSMNTFMTLFASMALTLTAFASNNNDGTTRYKVDASASSLTWYATKVTGEHMGTVNLANGYFTVTDGNLTSANVIVDMQTIACTDLEGEWGTKLVGHLNSDDFFNVSEHKTSSFTLRNMTPLKEGSGEATHTVTGEFTIRGITKSVTFDAKVTNTGDAFAVEGSAVLNRAEFDVKYGSGSFFENLGDNLIHDNFTVGFNLVAKAL